MQFALIGRLILRASSLDSFIKNPVTVPVLLVHCLSPWEQTTYVASS
jgi:hypothetical protein